MNKTVFVVGGDASVRAMFHEAGWTLIEPDARKGAIIPEYICFTGGADVSPELYGEKNTHSHTNPARDRYEQDVFNTFFPKGSKFIGICRGGQFLNVMSGGKMIQHYDGHGMRIGKAVDPTEEPEGSIYDIHEDHHQVMVPGEGADVLLAALPWKDMTPECIWYEKTRAFCFQPHPEWGHNPTKKLFFDLIKEKFA